MTGAAGSKADVYEICSKINQRINVWALTSGAIITLTDKVSHVLFVL